MIELPSGRQTFEFDCGAKALQLVMAYYGVERREDELMRDLGAKREGVPVNDMIAVAERNGFKVIAKCDVDLEIVKQYVDEGRPVIVLLQAWAERYMTIEDWQKDTDDGHYAIVIGHDGLVIVFEDPSSFRKTWLTEEEFMARWHDYDADKKVTFNHFAMVLYGKEPVQKKLEHMN